MQVNHLAAVTAQRRAILDRDLFLGRQANRLPIEQDGPVVEEVMGDIIQPVDERFGRPVAAQHFELHVLERGEPGGEAEQRAVRIPQAKIDPEIERQPVARISEASVRNVAGASTRPPSGQ